MLRAKLKCLLDGDASQDALLQFVDESMKVHERKALLEVEEWIDYLAMINLNRFNLATCCKWQHYAEAFGWSSL